MNARKVAGGLGVATLLAAAMTCFAGCGSDVGDSSAGPGTGDDSSADGATGADATQGSGDDTGTPDSTVASGDSTSPQPDSNSTQEDSNSTADVGSTQEDTGSSQDAGTAEDTGSSPDTGSGQQDATVEDAPMDSTVPEGGPADTGSTVDAVADVAAESGGGHEAGADSGSTPDAGGGHDAATEAGSDGGGALVPCTTGLTNCVKCQGNETGTGANGGLCTPTEALLVQTDIKTGLATAPGDDPADGCYACLYNAGCLDDTVYSSDMNNECGDPLTTGTAAECLATMSCIIDSGCAKASTVECYCGTAPESGSCNNSAPNGAANGACDSQIATGNGLAVNDGHKNELALLNPALASGKAVSIFQCAINNGPCPMCFP